MNLYNFQHILNLYSIYYSMVKKNSQKKYYNMFVLFTYFNCVINICVFIYSRFLYYHTDTVFSF